MNLDDIIDRLRNEVDMYSPMPSSFRTRRQRREDRCTERILNFLITVLSILNTQSSLDNKVEEIIARIAFLDENNST